MPYSILEGERPQARPHHLYHVFSRAEWERYPFAAPEDVRWFREAKLGLFLHVGLSAMGGVDLSWPRHTHKPPDGGAGPIPDEVYDHWAEELALPAFDARAWVRMAQEAGMRYIVIVAKHHDGFHMWDTAFSDYKITNAPFGRDYLRELVDACHEAGMRVGIYYSQRDWKHPDYEPVPPELAARASGQRFCWPQGEELRITPRHRRYIEYLRATVHELMTRYGRIDILWWDAAWWGGMFLAGMWDAENVEKESRAAQPHLLINDRASLPGDFDTPEGSVGFFQSHRPWETCMPLGRAWAWTGEGVKSFREILHQCVQCVCGDGNYLLSVGCMPNGDFDAPEKQRLRELGAWLGRYGEAVYGTRGGPWLPGAWGGSTHRGNTAYLHLLGAAAGKQLTLPPIAARVLRAECLSGEKVEVEQCDGGVSVRVAEGQAVGEDVVIRLELDRAPSVPSPTPARDAFAAAPGMYGPCVFERSLDLPAVVPIPEDRLLTGVALDLPPDARIRVEVELVDGRRETLRAEACAHEELPVLREEAGALIAGRACRALRLSGAPCRATVKVYAIARGA